MIYPCAGCLVDVMCINACDKFVWYMDEIKSVLPSMIINTVARYRRACRSASMYQRSPKLYTFLTHSRDSFMRNDNPTEYISKYNY